MTLTVRQLAEQVHGEVAGDGDLVIADARTLGDARPGDITFLQPGEKNLAAWHNCPAAAAVAPLDTPVNGRPLIRVADPLAAFAAVVMRFRNAHAPTATGRIDPTASVHPSAKLGPGTTIGPFVSVGEESVVGARCHLYAGVVVGRHCTVGDDCTFHPHVVLYDDSVVGHRVTVHANAVLGADGFGYRTQGGKHVKVPQLGSIEIADDVDIGAGSTIDRGTFGPTRIGAGTKIDNLVMIGHNCQIGRHNLLVGQVGMAGSCSTGDYVVMAGQVGIADHIHVGERAVVGAKSGIMKDVPDGTRMFGYPARPDKEAMRITACLEKVPDLVKEVKKLKAALGLAEEHGVIEPVGLVAGAGRFPIAFAEKARACGIPVVCVGVAGMADPKLADLCTEFHWLRRLSLGFVLRTLRRGGVSRWTMAGKFHKHVLFQPRWVLRLIPDWRAARFWYLRRRSDNRDDSILLGLIDEFRAGGLECVSALDLCPELLVRDGVLTKRVLTAAEERDARFGWTLAREMGRVDVGQSVMVRNRCALAVEAIEGTDAAIRRAGELARKGGFVVVKVAKPNQDMRFDVPTVGAATVEAMRAAGATALAIEAGRTILIDEAETVALADKYGIAIAAMSGD